MSEPVVTMRDVTFRYGNGGGRAATLEDIHLDVHANDFLGLIGPNGGGKSTLLKLLLGVLAPDEGEIRVLGRPPQDVSRRIGYVPQDAHVDPETPATVLDVVLTGRLGVTSWGFLYGRGHVRAARAAMESAGVLGFENRTIRELSGGQRQRVLIARALASEARILLLDEPMAGVDLQMEQGILDTLRALNERMPIVLVSHDLGFVSRHVTRIGCLNRRLVVHRAEEVTREVIGEMYREVGPVHQLDHRPDCPSSEGAP